MEIVSKESDSEENNFPNKGDIVKVKYEDGTPEK